MVASTPYIPSNSPVVPVTAAQSEVGMNPYVPHSSVPAKFVPYGNLAVGNGGSAAQVSQPVCNIRLCYVLVFTFLRFYCETNAISASRSSNHSYLLIFSIFFL